jgi:hypothetical protein
MLEFTPTERGGPNSNDESKEKQTFHRQNNLHALKNRRKINRRMKAINLTLPFFILKME